MRHRIFVPQLPVTGDLSVTGSEFHHAARVVRLHEAEEVELFDGRGRAVAARVASIGSQELLLRIEADIDSREMRRPITLAMAVIQLDKFELVLQKATELGAAAIIPLVTDRVEVRPERYRGKRDRWEKIIFEAVKQSGRAAQPALGEPATFEEVLGGDSVRIVFDADTEPSADPIPAETPATLLIGPEGGWSERELALAQSAGCVFQRLGRRRLRAETAAIVAIATTAARSGELD